jgi:photosystem II stability/assembly factor-like uncharacterized protein
VSPPRQRLLATAVLLLGVLLGLSATLGSASASSPPADTWTLLSAAPAGVGRNPVFALTVDPTNAANLLYGTSAGEIYRSTDGGASWVRVATGVGQGVLALAFDPIEPTHVLAGTRAAGIWRSDDSGKTWHSLDHGSESVRDFAFSLGLSAAATDRGVLVTHDGDTWQPADLQQASVAAVAVGSGQITAGADLDAAAKGLPLFQSSDSGSTWRQLSSLSGAGSLVAALGLAGGKLVVGTNAGLYVSPDGGGTWTSLSNAALPATDFTDVTSSPGNRVYVASDGGASANGGLWVSGDGAQSFRSLQVPVPSVTAVALFQSTLYVATFRPLDHATFLWSYVDDGGATQQPAAGVVPAPKPLPVTAAAAKPVSTPWLDALLRGPELPYLALGALALLIIFLALIAYLRRGRV